MSKKRWVASSGMAVFVIIIMAYLGVAKAAVIGLYEYEVNIDGFLNGSNESDSLPAVLDLSGFDASAGLGVVTVRISGAGSHFAGMFVDHEIDADDNTFFNEVGSVSGGAATVGQSWEIDEPGYVDGDIYENFQAGALDNSIGRSSYGGTNFPDDVSMALGWDFMLDTTEIATISFYIQTVQPLLTDFYLIQADPDSVQSLYFYSQLNIHGVMAVSETSGGVLLLLGFIGLMFARQLVAKLEVVAQ